MVVDKSLWMPTYEVSYFHFVIYSRVCNSSVTACTLTCLISQSLEILLSFLQNWDIVIQQWTKKWNCLQFCHLGGDSQRIFACSSPPALVLYLQSKDFCKMSPVFIHALSSYRGAPVCSCFSGRRPSWCHLSHLWASFCSSFFVESCTWPSHGWVPLVQ